MGISAIILAAGFGERFGADKLMLGLNGRPLISYVLENAVGAGFDEVVAVTNDARAARLCEMYGAVCVASPHARNGQGASVRAGAVAARTGNGVMFFAGDQPLLKRETITAILHCGAQNPGKAVVPLFDGVSGNPVLFPFEYRKRLAALADNRTGKTLISAGDVIYAHCAGGCQGFDVDTPADYNRLLLKASNTVVVRGGGDIATGAIQALRRAGFGVAVLETNAPTAIRRGAALSEAVYDGEKTVEDVTAQLVNGVEDMPECFRRGVVPVLVDPAGGYIADIGAFAVVDAIIAKRNTGTHMEMAPVTVAMGPGFEAGADADIVIETMRGHDLGRLITAGYALPNTGVPGEVSGFSSERVIHCPADGRLTVMCGIGERVAKGQVIANVSGLNITAPIGGLLRGILRDNHNTFKGMKIADIDPRPLAADVAFTVSDKARALGGAALQAVLMARRLRIGEISNEQRRS